MELREIILELEDLISTLFFFWVGEEGRKGGKKDGREEGRDEGRKEGRKRGGRE